MVELIALTEEVLLDTDTVVREELLHWIEAGETVVVLHAVVVD